MAIDKVFGGRTGLGCPGPKFYILDTTLTPKTQKLVRAPGTVAMSFPVRVTVHEFL